MNILCFIGGYVLLGLIASSMHYRFDPQESFFGDFGNANEMDWNVRTLGILANWILWPLTSGWVLCWLMVKFIDWAIQKLFLHFKK
jgi:hypothetical protein